MPELRGIFIANIWEFGVAVSQPLYGPGVGF
jgi:hypothetical protein